MKWVLVLVVALILLGGSGYSQISVNANKTAIALAQSLAGPGVTISNPLLRCNVRANGTFSAIHSNLGLDSGIVLTTGSAATQGSFIGINGSSGLFASTSNGMPGDTMLTPLAGRPTYDACSLEFDVVPKGDSISFSYVFSSEEYISAVCGAYNDVFGFFISGPGITGRDNMALVPGTDIPVTINTINDGVPGSSGSLYNCTIMGPGSPFTAYYTDNTTGTTLTHEGLTHVLQAKHAVLPCNTYHLKLTIADAGNATYDSGVFLKAGSLATSSYIVRAVTRQGKDTTLGYCVKGCAPGKFVVRRTRADNRPQTIKFVTGGDAVSGIDYSPIADSVVIPAASSSAEVTVNGLLNAAHNIKTLRLFILYSVPCTGTNDFSDSAAMIIYDTIHTTTGINDTAICLKDSVQMLVGGEDIFSYQWLPAAGLNDPTVRNPVASPSAATTYTVTVSLPGSTCKVKQQEVHIDVRLTPVVSTISDTTVCRNAQLALTATTTVANPYYSYFWTGPAGFASTLSDPVAPIADSANAGIYALKVTIDTNACSGSAAASVSVSIPPMPQVSPPRVYCQGRIGDALSAVGDSLLWYIGLSDTGHADAPTPYIRAAGDYHYYVSQTVDGCESRRADVAVSVQECCKGVVVIPSAFTPNNDGRNDVFRVTTSYGYRIDRFYIYNRWGQELYSGLDGVWNGTLQGRDADPGTYYYTLVLGCIIGGTEVRRGDVTLIR